jgi:integrase
MPRPANRPKQLKSGLWQIVYRDDKGKQVRAAYPSQAEAQAVLDATRSSVRSGAYIDPKRGRELLSVFGVEWGDAQDWKETTRQYFPAILRRILDVLGDVPLDTVDQLALKRARVALAKKYAPKTVTLTMTYLYGIMRAAYQTGRIPRDPTIGARSQRRQAKLADRVSAEDVPTRAEVRSLWAAAPPKYRAAIALGTSGLRIGEVLGMTVDRIDLDRRLVTIDRQLQRVGNESKFTTPKGEKARTIKVPAPVALELRQHPRDLRGGGLLFVTPRSGAPMRRDEFYKAAWRPTLAEAGLATDRYVFHSLRHFAASSMLAEGVNPMAVAGHLGDQLETLQRVYAHWLRDDQDVPADALERILANPDPATGTAES